MREIQLSLGASYLPLLTGQLRDRIVLVEGRRGTAKTRSILTILVIRALASPGAQFLIMRSARTRLTETVIKTFDKQVLPLFQLPAVGVQYTQLHTYKFPNGSEFIFMALDDPQRTQSGEYDGAYVAEAVELTNQDLLLGVAGSLRAHGVEVPFRQLIADCNPGAPGHWANKIAEPADDSLRTINTRADWQRTLKFNAAPAKPGQVKRMITSWADNPGYFDVNRWALTPNGEDYLVSLGYQRGAQKDRWLHGLWVADEGSVYPEFSERTHVITPFEIPEEWPIHLGYDPGFDHPCAVLWFAVAPNDCHYVIDEIYGGGMRVPKLSEMIHHSNAGRNMRGYYGDPQEINSERQASESIAAQFRKAKYPIKFGTWPRSTDVDAMVQAVAARLLAGSLKVFSSCTNTINEFQSWKFKRNAKGEPLEGDEKYEDRNNDAMDVVKGIVALNLRFTRRAQIVSSE